MERYEFEDLISDFIENNLSLKKRKLFLEYLEKNQSSKKLVDEIRNNIKKLNRSPKLSASHDFNDRLISSVKNIELKPELMKSNDKRRLYGFSYLQSGLIFCFLILFGLIGQYLLFDEYKSEKSIPYFTKMKENNIELPLDQNDNYSSQKLVTNSKDSLKKNLINNSYKKDLNKIKLVKN